jgi:hypothetical protein
MEKRKEYFLFIINSLNQVELPRFLTNLANSLSEEGYTVEILLLMKKRAFLPFKF